MKFPVSVYVMPGKREGKEERSGEMDIAEKSGEGRLMTLPAFFPVGTSHQDFFIGKWGGGIVPTISRQASSIARIMLMGRMCNPT